MSFNIWERKREVSKILQLAAAGNTFAKFSYFSPKNQFPKDTIMFYLYIQPFLILCFVVWLIVLIYALWTDKYMKKYGLMTLYSCLDLIMIGTQNLVFIYVFTLEENYLQYEMCYVYEILTQGFPRAFFLISQWLKVCQAFQKYLVLSKPMTYKDIFKKLNVGIFLTISIILGISVAVVHFLSIDFEKVVTIDKKTMETIDICRDRFAFSTEPVEVSEYVFWVEVVYCIVSAVFPCILMLVFSIFSIKALRKQAEFRKRLNVNTSGLQTGLERLVKVTSAATVCFAFLTLPQLLGPISMKENELLLGGEYLSFIYAILFMLNIPLNFLMFSWQSKTFRDKITTILRRRSSQD